MSQLGRWIDVEVEYEGKKPTCTMDGNAERNIPVSELLELLEEMRNALLNKYKRNN